MDTMALMAIVIIVMIVITVTMVTMVTIFIYSIVGDSFRNVVIIALIVWLL